MYSNSHKLSPQENREVYFTLHFGAKGGRVGRAIDLSDELDVVVVDDVEVPLQGDIEVPPQDDREVLVVADTHVVAQDDT